MFSLFIASWKYDRSSVILFLFSRVPFIHISLHPIIWKVQNFSPKTIVMKWRTIQTLAQAHWLKIGSTAAVIVMARRVYSIVVTANYYYSYLDRVEMFGVFSVSLLVCFLKSPIIHTECNITSRNNNNNKILNHKNSHIHSKSTFLGLLLHISVSLSLWHFSSLSPSSSLPRSSSLSRTLSLPLTAVAFFIFFRFYIFSGENTWFSRCSHAFVVQ